MKTMLQKLLCLLLGVLVGTALPAFAQATQLEEKTYPVSAFSSISVSNDFEVTLIKGNYSAKITTDRELAPYIQVYVRSKTLYITYDEKSVPKDVKKQYKGRGAPKAVFRTVIYMPEVNGISLSDNVTLMSADEFSASNFELTLADKSQVKNLSLRASSAAIYMKKNAQASMTMRVDNRLEINTENNANLRLTATSVDLVLHSEDASEVALTGESRTATLGVSGSAKVMVTQKTDRAVLQGGGSAELTLTGSADTMLLNSEKNPKLDATNFSVRKLEANMNGKGECKISVSEQLSATLENGSALYYNGSPQIQIGKIIKATLAPIGSR